MIVIWVYNLFSNRGFRTQKRTWAANTQLSAARCQRIALNVQDRTASATVAPYFIRALRLRISSNASLLAIVAFGCLALPAQALPIQPLPKDENLQCVHASWEQIVIFILVNYVTHAMTVKAEPGEKPISAAMYNIAAVLLPFTGAMRGLIAIFDAPILENGLRRAARAQAL